MRLQLFEWEDFSWYPDLLRTAQTDYLRFLMETFDVFRVLIPHLGSALEKSETTHLIDFCSGGGGSIKLIQKHLEKSFPELNFKATLTDLYPNQTAFKLLEKESDGKITFLEKSVDVRQIPEELRRKGFWTIFNGFHHLNPTEANNFLETAVVANRPFGIFEPLDKSLLQVIVNTFALTVLMFLVTPFIRPFRWSRLVFTYLIPLIPFFTLWDGYVSIIRLYTPKMLRAMVKNVEGHQTYEWQIGKARHVFGTVIYLIGLPKNGSNYKNQCAE